NPKGAAQAQRSQVSALLLLALDRLEERLEVAFPEAAGAVALDQLEEDRWPVAERGGEDLEQVPLVISVDQDPEPLKVLEPFVDLTDALGHLVVVGLGGVEEADSTRAKLGDRLDDVFGGERDVLRARSLVELQI